MTAGRRLLPLLALATLACQVPATAPDHTPGQSGSSIALLPDGKRLAVVDPDQGSVSILDADTLEPLGRIAVGGEPHQLVVAGDLIYVATYRGGEVVVVDATQQKVVNRLAVCAGPWGLALAPAGWLAVGCEWQGEVLQVSADLSQVQSRGKVWRVRAVAVQGETVRAANYAGPDAQIWTLTPEAVTSVRPIPSGADDGRPELAQMAASQITALCPLADGGLLATLQLVANAPGESTSPASGYGDGADGHPKINPALVHLDAENRLVGPATYARYDNSGRAFNLPSGLALASPGRAVVAHLSSNDVAQLDLTAPHPDARLIGRQVAAKGARGVAVSAERGLAWVDGAFENAVTRLPLEPILAASAATRTRVRPLPQPFSPAARAGRLAFHDATNPHLTPAGVVACNSCHADGGDDGLVWQLHAGTVTPRLRRSQHLGVAPIGAAGLHWDAEFLTLGGLLQSTVPNLMGGDALGLNPEEFSAYAHEIVQVPLPPPGDPLAIARGGALFASPALGCTRCHSGPNFTDLARHVALRPMATLAGDTLSAARTPSLRGVFLRAPYFHDGRAADLVALHQRSDLADHGDPTQLEPGDMADLVAYLNQL